MKTRVKVSHRIILGIVLIISTLLTIPRVLSWFKVTEKLVESYTDVTFTDLIIRFLSLFLLTTLILYLNTNWKYYYSNFSKVIVNTITILLNTLIFFTMVWLFVLVYNIIETQQLPESEIGLTYFVYFVVTIISFYISRVLTYQIVHRRDLLEKEKLKQESLKQELTALKNQVNPHFLFNSLSSLSSIVKENKEGVTFISKLSSMYRYILQSGEKDLVTTTEELKFLKSYLHLMKTRYKNRLQIEINILKEHLPVKIPPLALQLLVENAIKHNEISEKHTLLIRVFSVDDAICVENKIRLRTSLVESTANGLPNLDKRYFLLKRKHIIISDQDAVFRVKLPL